MNDLSDTQLLDDYAARRSETAFAELVRRHIDLVHSAALRMVNDSHAAKDISQAVFVALAKDAGKLAKHPVLAGWLHRTARNIASQSVRTDVRRRQREQLAVAMNADPEAAADWQEIAPHLDAALAELGDPDRDAVLLRYFENKPAREMATILGISAEAAQKRVNRAVERLRESLAKRGITAGTAGLAGVISANAVQVAPVGLAGAVSTAAFAGTTSVAMATTHALAGGAVRKALLTVAVSVSVGLAIHQSNRASKLQHQNQTLQQAGIGQSTRMIRPRLPRSGAEPGNSGEATADSPDNAGGFQVMGSVGGPSDPGDFSLIAPAGRGITTGAAEAAGLSAEQRKAVDKTLREMWKRVTADFASRAELVEAESDITKGVSAFNIPARSDLGREFISQLESTLDAEVGASKREILMRGISSTDFLGGFGALNVHLKFTPNGACKWTLSESPSGKWVGSVETGPDGFIDNFGDSFDLPESHGYPRYH